MRCWVWMGDVLDITDWREREREDNCASQTRRINTDRSCQWSTGGSPGSCPRPAEQHTRTSHDHWSGSWHQTIINTISTCKKLRAIGHQRPRALFIYLPQFFPTYLVSHLKWPVTSFVWFSAVNTAVASALSTKPLFVCCCKNFRQHLRSTRKIATAWNDGNQRLINIYRDSQNVGFTGSCISPFDSMYLRDCFLNGALRRIWQRKKDSNSSRPTKDKKRIHILHCIVEFSGDKTFKWSNKMWKQKRKCSWGFRTGQLWHAQSWRDQLMTSGYADLIWHWAEAVSCY